MTNRRMTKHQAALLIFHSLVALGLHVADQAELQPEPTIEPATEATTEEATTEAESEAESTEATTEGEPTPVQGQVEWPWGELADCESGDWLPDGGFAQGSARWAWGGSDPIPPWGNDIHEGGLQFHPGTWAAYRSPGDPERAYDASPTRQVAVAERVLEVEGWEAWPTCSAKLGLR